MFLFFLNIPRISSSQRHGSPLGTRICVDTSLSYLGQSSDVSTCYLFSYFPAVRCTDLWKTQRWLFFNCGVESCRVSTNYTMKGILHPPPPVKCTNSYCFQLFLFLQPNSIKSINGNIMIVVQFFVRARILFWCFIQTYQYSPRNIQIDFIDMAIKYWSCIPSHNVYCVSTGTVR